MARRRLALPLGVAIATGSIATAHAAGSGPGVQDVAPVALALAVILVAAKLGGDWAIRVGQPSVLGELLVGVVLGNLSLLGISGFDSLTRGPFIDMLAHLGVLLLLFEVGLESTVKEMLHVGPQALLVASLGVLAPFALGWGVGALFLPSEGVHAHAFLGATLCATSVGITARVLRDLKRSRTAEARVILGAAVIDDVLGLVILAVVSSVISAADSGRTLSYWDMGVLLLKAGGFLGGSLFLGVLLSPRLFHVASRLRSPSVLLAVGLSFCFSLAWLASRIGLAPIVGAFAAGLILKIPLQGLQGSRRGGARAPHPPDSRRSWCRCSSSWWGCGPTSAHSRTRACWRWRGR